MELEDDWDPLEPLDPQDAACLLSLASFLEEIEAPPALLESESESDAHYQLTTDETATGRLPAASQPLAASPGLVPILPAPALTYPALSVSASSTAPTAWQRKRQRQRPQDEIDELRRQVYELTAQLDALRFQEAHGGRVDPAVLRNTPPATWKLLQSARASYRAMAIDQREARRRSESENAWLRALVRSASTRASHMKDAFESHLAAANTRGRMANPLVASPGTASLDRQLVFAELLAGLDALYCAADEMLGPHQPIPAQFPVRQIERRRSVFGEAFISFVESRVLPFELGVVERALWKALLGQSTRVHPNFERDFSEEISGDTMLTSSRLGLRRGDSDLDIRIHIATRRYVEQERIVVASQTLVEPKMSDSAASVGVTYRETRIRVLKRASASGNAAPSTVMQSHHAVHRESAALEPPGEGWSNGQDTAFAVHGWRHSVLALNQAIENLVLDEAVGRSKRFQL